MTEERFNNWEFRKDQTVLYRDENYELLGVDFEANKVLIKFNNQDRWISYKEIELKSIKEMYNG
jgi:hypothetical protein